MSKRANETIRPAGAPTVEGDRPDDSGAVERLAGFLADGDPAAAFGEAKEAGRSRPAVVGVAVLAALAAAVVTFFLLRSSDG